MPFIYGIIILAAILIVWIISGYNRLVVLRNRANEAWSDINVQLKRRYDLIPNLVQTVKGYAAHERELLEKVTQARAKAMSATSAKDKGQAENALSETLKSLFAVSENYPQLRASDNFLELQRELSDTENKISASRRFYNSNVMELNIKIETFPSNIVASLFGFSKMDLFQLEQAEAKEPVQVKF